MLRLREDIFAPVYGGRFLKAALSAANAGPKGLISFTFQFGGFSFFACCLQSLKGLQNIVFGSAAASRLQASYPVFSVSSLERRCWSLHFPPQK